MDVGLVLLVLLGLSSARTASVFLDPDRAHRVLGPGLARSNSVQGPGLARSHSALRPASGPVLVRTRRFNSGWFEELQRGDLRRECVEEVCSYEEAREVFEHTETTNEFWKTYRVQNSCSSGPCLNGGTCVDRGPDFTCLCPQHFSGLTCHLDDRAARRRCLVENGGCDHFCEEQGAEPKCTCADGYHLEQDERTCKNTEPIACGMVPVLQGRTSPQLDPRARIVGGTECPKGECPWQVLLLNKGKGFCGGVFLNPDWVLTAAHCLQDINRRHLQVVAGEHDVELVEGTEQQVQVLEVHVHERYEARTADSDIALLRLATPLAVTSHAVPACLPTRAHAHTQLMAQDRHQVSGWGRVHEAGPTSRVLRRLQVPVIRTQTCLEQSGLVLTRNMFCAGFVGGQQDSCKGDSGGPLVTRFRRTYFLLGLVSWGRGCARPGQYGVYTRVYNYLGWIRAKTGVGPGQDQDQNPEEVQSETGPEKSQSQNQDQTRATGHQNHNETTTDQDQTRTGVDQSQNHNKTGSGLEQSRDQDQTGTGVDQSQNHNKTGSGLEQSRDQDQTRTRPNLDFIYNQTTTELDQDQNQDQNQTGTTEQNQIHNKTGFGLEQNLD